MSIVNDEQRIGLQGSREAKTNKVERSTRHELENSAKYIDYVLCNVRLVAIIALRN